jgi:hypothetical protein
MSLQRRNNLGPRFSDALVTHEVVLARLNVEIALLGQVCCYALLSVVRLGRG